MSDPDFLRLYLDKLNHIMSISQEAETRGMKDLHIMPDHVLIELKSKTYRIWYADERVEEVE